MLSGLSPFLLSLIFFPFLPSYFHLNSFSLVLGRLSPFLRRSPRSAADVQLRRQPGRCC